MGKVRKFVKTVNENKRVIISLACCGIIVALVFLVGWVFEPGIPAEKFRQLKIGMTANEVEQIIGKPDEILQNRIWIYLAPINKAVLEFDKDGKLKSFVDYD